MVAFNKNLEGTVSNPVWGFIICKASCFQSAELQHSCKDHDFVSFFTSQVQKN